jgi:hypothetical protein
MNEHIKIDGHSGKGTFFQFQRSKENFEPAYDPNPRHRDMGYLAYVPGEAGHKPGESFNLEFRVERYGRFAKRPMTEKEFRKLTLTIAASIKRRPDGWKAQ